MVKVEPVDQPQGLRSGVHAREKEIPTGRTLWGAGKERHKAVI